MEISDGAHFRWYFGDIVSDDADKGGSGDTDEPDLLEFEAFFGDPSSGIVLGEWKTAYKGIAYCNIALENIPGIDMDELEKSALLGEAQFLRAYWYFNLVTTLWSRPSGHPFIGAFRVRSAASRDQCDLGSNRGRS